HLLSEFGAKPEDARVVVDGNVVSTAGVSAGIDGALAVAAMLAGEPVAQRIQLEMQYAPEPPFHSVTPSHAPPPTPPPAPQSPAPLSPPVCHPPSRPPHP